MTKQNKVISIIYWAIYVVFGFLIWLQHDSTSNETVVWFGILWSAVYILAVIIYKIQKSK